MQLSEAEKGKLRARLASRKSFFGGLLTTAQESVAADYIPVKDRPREEPEPKPKPQPKARSNFEPSAIDKGDSGTSKVKTQRASAVDYSDFAALESDSPLQEQKSLSVRSKPINKSQSHIAKTTGQAPSAIGRNPISLGAKTASKGPQHRPSHPARAASLPSVKQPTASVASRGLTSLCNLSNHSPSRGLTSPNGLSRHSPPPRPPQGLPNAKRPGSGKTATQQHRVKKGAATRRVSIQPQALGGPTRSQKANQAWADAAAKLRNPDALNRITIPEDKGQLQNVPGKAADCKSSRPPFIAPASRASASFGSPDRRLALSPRTAGQGFQKLNLAGKDLSKLPEWQRQLLEKKWREQTSRKRQREELDEYEDEGATSEDDFVVDDDAADWRSELKAITGYDPSKFRGEPLDDRSMEADWKSIQAEERKSAKLGRSEDEKAEMEELARQKIKAAVKKKYKKSSGFVLE